jgi:hypothetical protein
VYEAHLGFGMGAKIGAAVILIAGAGSCSRDDRGRGVVRRLATCRGCIRWIAHGVGKTQPDKFVVDEGIAQENVA